MSDGEQMVPLPRLEGFYWVAKTGGYAAAARAFPYAITQPAVHQQVKKLEATLDVKLFERIGKDRMHLTPAGQVVYDFCRPFFHGWPAVARSLASGEHGGALKLGAQPLLLRHLLPAWIKRVQRRCPNATLSLCELTGADVSPLVEGAIDLAVGYLPDRPTTIAARRIGSLYPFVVLPRGHALANVPANSMMRKLSGERFVAFPEGHPGRTLQEQALERADCRPGEILCAGTVDSILGFVEADLGFSLVPFVDEAGPRGRGIVAVPLPKGLVVPIEVLWREDTPANPLLDAALASAPTD